MSNNSIVNVTLTNSGSGYISPHQNVTWGISAANPHNKPVRRTTYDLLAVSSHLYRVYGNDSTRFFQGLGMGEFDGVEKFKLTDEDFKLADNVADYFSKMIVLRELRGEKITDFHREVAGFLTDRYNFNYEIVGVIYRLPEYYDMDRRFLTMKDTHFNEHEYVSILTHRHSRTLVPLDKISKMTRAYKVDQYWFKDKETGNPVNIDIDHKNKLSHIWDYFFDTVEELDIEGEYYDWTHQLKVQCTTVKNWELKL